MKLGRFNSAAKHIVQDETVMSSCQNVAVYRRYDGNWFDIQGAKSSDAALCENLEKTLMFDEPWRARKSNVEYFPLSQLEAIAVLTFGLPPRKQTVERAKRRLDECVTRGIHEFDATHDDLTGFLNRAAFDACVVDELRKQPQNTLSPVEKTDSTGAICVIAFDIDYFKQINDTFGHLYGDCVLRCLARRVENICADLQVTFPEVRIRCARPSGGEEFAVLVAGAFSIEHEVTFAETIREGIARAPLPDEREWETLKKEGLVPDGVNLPSASERDVRISVGISSLRNRLVATKADEECKTLKNRADVALYRAKGAGRNRSVAFSNILAKYGRILEHNAETDVVVIDLGRQVNVATGQEFVVFHPTFTGTEPFMFRDGRTERRLGTYPRVPVGRIEVFEVQPEVAFCNVIERRGSAAFAVGSALEAVPVGTITHILGSDKFAISSLSKVNDLEAAVVKIVAESDPPSVCAISLTNHLALSEKYGTAFVNRVLAKTFATIRSRCPTGTTVGQIAPTLFAAVAPGGAQLDDEIIRSILSDTAQEFGGIPKLSAGAFNSQDAAGFYSGQQDKHIDAKGALDFARFAVIEGELLDMNVCHFDQSTTWRILFLSRPSKNLEQARADYQTFAKWKATDPRLENALAVILIEAGKFQEASEAIQRGLQENPADWNIWANGGLIAYYLDDLVGAATRFARAKDITPDRKFEGVYLIPCALAFYDAYRSGNPKVGVEELRSLLEAAKAHAESTRRPADFVERISRALAQIAADHEATTPPP